MAALFDRYSRLVYSIALRVLREPDLAEDVMQEVLLQVWRQPGGFVSQRGSLGAWLAVVARNRSIDVIRRRAHMTPIEDMVLPEPRNMQKAVEENHLMDQVRVAVDTLPKEQQQPLHMAYFEGLTHTEISERTGTSAGNGQNAHSHGVDHGEKGAGSITMPEAFHIDEDDLIQYALGSLRETQLGTLTAHISLCNQCRSALAQVQLDLAAFATVQPLSDVPTGARDRFLAKLTSDAAGESKLVQMRNKSRLYIVGKSFKHWLETPMPLKILSGALAAALLFVAYDDVSHIHQIRQFGPAMARLEHQAADLAELKEFLHGSNAQQVTLHEKPATTKAPEGHTLYSATTGKLVFTASNMPAVPAGKTYELWVIPAGKGAPHPGWPLQAGHAGQCGGHLPRYPRQRAGGRLRRDDRERVRRNIAHHADRPQRPIGRTCSAGQLTSASYSPSLKENRAFAIALVFLSVIPLRGILLFGCPCLFTHYATA